MGAACTPHERGRFFRVPATSGRASSEVRYLLSSCRRTTRSAARVRRPRRPRPAVRAAGRHRAADGTAALRHARGASPTSSMTASSWRCSRGRRTSCARLPASTAARSASWATSRTCSRGRWTSTPREGGAFRPHLRCLQHSAGDTGRCSRIPARHQQEHNGIIRRGAKLLYAYARRRFPAFRWCCERLSAAPTSSWTPNPSAPISPCLAGNQIAVMGAVGAGESLPP